MPVGFHAGDLVVLNQPTHVPRVLRRGTAGGTTRGTACGRVGGTYAVSA